MGKNKATKKISTTKHKNTHDSYIIFQGNALDL